MSLNNRAMKYVPTTAKNGKIVAMGFGVEVGDLEVISSAHISDSLCDGNRSFVGVISRTPHDIEACGQYEGYSEEDMVGIRLHEAIKAANIASYNSLYLLNYGELKELNEELISDYKELLAIYRPDIIFTYSPFDSDHEHIVSLKAVLKAIEQVENYVPKHVYAVNYDGDFGELAFDDIVVLDLESRSDVISSMLMVYSSLHESGEEIVPAITAFDLCSDSDENHFVAPNLHQFCNTVLNKLKDQVEENLK